MRSRILFLSGHPEDAPRLAKMLHGLPVILDHVETVEQARTKLQEKEYNVVLTESRLRDGNWLNALHLVRALPHDLNVIVTDAHADARFWAEALNLGAYDLLSQPFDESEVRRILYNACSRPVSLTAGSSVM